MLIANYCMYRFDDIMSKIEKIVTEIHNENDVRETPASAENIELNGDPAFNTITAGEVIGSKSAQVVNLESGSEIQNSEFIGIQYRLANNWFSHVNIDNYKYKAINYLEIGVFYGANILSVAKTYGLHEDSKLYCIDPWEDDYEDYTEYQNYISSVYDSYVYNIENFGVKNKIITRRGYSHIEVPKFQDNFFDIIYVDGNHGPEYVLEDAVLSFRKLKYNGIIIFDDYGWAGADVTQRGIDAFISGYRDSICVLGEKQSQIFIQKREKTRICDFDSGSDMLKSELFRSEPTQAAKMPSILKETYKEYSYKNHPYFTHQPFFIEILSNTTGDILELGCGDGSTLMIRELIKNTGRKLVTLESDLSWFNKYAYLSDDTHKLYYVNAGNDDTVETGNIWLDFIKSMQLNNFEIVFIDSSPWTSRQLCFDYFLDKVKIIIFHDFDYFPTNNIIGNVTSTEHHDGKLKINCNLDGVVKNYKLFYPPYEHFAGSTGPPTLVCSNTMDQKDFQIFISQVARNVSAYYD